MTLRQGYYFSGFDKYDHEGKNFEASRAWTDLYVTGARMTEFSSDEADDVWLPKLRANVRRAVEAGMRIWLTMNLADVDPPYRKTPRGRVLNQVAPFWNSVDWIELADEPGWNESSLASWVATVKWDLNAKGLEQKPLGLTHKLGWWLDNPWASAHLDWIGVEAYMDPPPGDDPNFKYEGAFPVATRNAEENRTLLRNSLREVRDAYRDKPILLVGQSYSRNGSWKIIPNLVALQRHTSEWALENTHHVKAILWFAYGRPSGIATHPELAESHREFWERLHPPAPPPEPPPPSPPPPAPPPATKSFFRRLLDWIRRLFE